MGHFKTFKKKKRKSNGGGGHSTKTWMRCENIWVFDRACWIFFFFGEEDLNKRKQERTNCHLKVQVDTQTWFLLPAVSNVTKRGQPGANSCPTWGGCLRWGCALNREAPRTTFQYSSLQQHSLLLPSASCYSEDPLRKISRKPAARNRLHTDSSLSHFFSFFNIFFLFVCS